MSDEAALNRVAQAARNLRTAQDDAKDVAHAFGKVCAEVYEQGINDRQMAKVADFSRARIQQYRKAALVAR